MAPGRHEACACAFACPGVPTPHFAPTALQETRAHTRTHTNCSGLDMFHYTIRRFIANVQCGTLAIRHECGPFRCRGEMRDRMRARARACVYFEIERCWPNERKIRVIECTRAREHTMAIFIKYIYVCMFRCRYTFILQCMCMPALTHILCVCVCVSGRRAAGRCRRRGRVRVRSPLRPSLSWRTTASARAPRLHIIILHGITVWGYVVRCACARNASTGATYATRRSARRPTQRM